MDKTEKKWKEIMKDWNSTFNQKRHVKKLCRQGIPHGIRGSVWKHLANIEYIRQAGLYEQLTGSPRFSIFEIIDRDIHRCYPGEFIFIHS